MGKENNYLYYSFRTGDSFDNCFHGEINMKLSYCSWWRRKGAWSISQRNGSGQRLPASWVCHHPRARAAPSRPIMNVCSILITYSKKDRLFILQRFVRPVVVMTSQCCHQKCVFVIVWLSGCMSDIGDTLECWVLFHFVVVVSLGVLCKVSFGRLWTCVDLKRKKNPTLSQFRTDGCFFLHFLFVFFCCNRWK